MVQASSLEHDWGALGWAIDDISYLNFNWFMILLLTAPKEKDGLGGKTTIFLFEFWVNLKYGLINKCIAMEEVYPFLTDVLFSRQGERQAARELNNCM